VKLLRIERRVSLVTSGVLPSRGHCDAARQRLGQQFGSSVRLFQRTSTSCHSLRLSAILMAYHARRVIFWSSFISQAMLSRMRE